MQHCVAVILATAIMKKDTYNWPKLSMEPKLICDEWNLDIYQKLNSELEKAKMPVLSPFATMFATIPKV